MIIDSLLVSIINSPQTIKTNPTVERTIKVIADELIRFGMFVAGIVSTVHLLLINKSYPYMK
jgi:hypothetical protein